MSQTFSRYLVSNSRTGGKFWEIEVAGDTVKTRYGKLGADPKWSSKTLPSPEKALAEAEKLVLKKTRKGYSAQPRITIAEGFAGVDLSTISLAGIFYFRAHDRWPGGNADMITAKVTLIAHPGQPPTLHAATHRNWDGQHHRRAEHPLPLDATATLPAVLEAATALIAAGVADGEHSIHDARYDSEAYDTEWSSIEIRLIAIPEGGDLDAIDAGTPFLRLRRKAVYTAQRGKVPPHEPPDAVSQRLLDSVAQLCGIGRVEQHSESQDDFSRAFEGPSRDLGHIGEMPLYL